MNTSDHFVVSDQQIMSQANNYNSWLFGLSKPYLGKSVLEIGAGVGNFSIEILNHPNVQELTMVDIDSECINEHKSNINNITDFKVDYIQGDFAYTNLYSNKFNTIIAFNVLEHIEQEDKAFQNIYRGLCSGGFAIILVPAFQFLKGSIDKRLGHYRRYNKHIKKRLQNAGLKVITMRYYNAIGFFGWFINFRILKRTQQSIKQVIIFDKYIFPIQKFIEKYTAWQPFGQSLYIVVKK